MHSRLTNESNWASADEKKGGGRTSKEKTGYASGPTDAVKSEKKRHKQLLST